MSQKSPQLKNTRANFDTTNVKSINIPSFQKQVRSVGDIVFNSICNMPTTITTLELNLLDSYPIEETILVLRELMNESKYGVSISSRAWDALMKLEKFDQVAFLINHYETHGEHWVQNNVAGTLSQFDDPRSKEFLCNIAISNPDPTIRHTAVWSLYKIGSEESISTLEHIYQNDVGVDYEGRKIAVMAEKALNRIRSEA